MSLRCLDSSRLVLTLYLCFISVHLLLPAFQVVTTQEERLIFFVNLGEGSDWLARAVGVAARPSGTSQSKAPYLGAQRWWTTALLPAT